MFFYKLSHVYKLIDHFERKDIGFYSSLSNAKKAMELLKQKNGFKESAEGFKIKRVFKIIKPRFLDVTFWIDGFDTYCYGK